jgi:hypothetical protein
MGEKTLSKSMVNSPCFFFLPLSTQKYKLAIRGILVFFQGHMYLLKIIGGIEVFFVFF